MFKCWSCGTEHELPAAIAAPIRELPATHDPLCRAVYQRYTDPKHCTSCDLIWAVREDDKERYTINIGKLEAAFLQGRDQGLVEAMQSIEAMPKEDGGYCHVVHYCEVLEEIQLLRRNNAQV